MEFERVVSSSTTKRTKVKSEQHSKETNREKLFSHSKIPLSFLEICVYFIYYIYIIYKLNSLNEDKLISNNQTRKHLYTIKAHIIN